MQPKELHDFLFQLFEFAIFNLLTGPVKDYPENMMTMVYIEDFMDVYGRQLIYQAAKDAGLDAEASLKKANEELDMLRAGLDAAFKQPDETHELRTTIDEAVRRLKRNYGTRE